MNKNALISLGVLVLFLSASLATAHITIEHQYQTEQNPKATPHTNEPLWLRLRNQINDMFGICSGNCSEELIELTGILTFDNISYYIDNIEIHFGPNWYITSITSPKDYDEDGIIETINEELQGLTNGIVTLKGYYQSENWFSVFNINNLTYRETGKPIWIRGNGN